MSQVARHQNGEDDGDGEAPVDDVEDWKELLGKRHFAVDQGEVKIECQAARPEERADRRGGCPETLKLAEIGEDGTALTASSVVDGIVQRTNNIAQSSEEVCNGKVRDECTRSSSNLLPSATK